MKAVKLIPDSLCLIAIVISNISMAQVTVKEEPHHKMVLENDYVRLFDGQIRFGDTTVLHVHATNSVVVFLSKSTFGIQNIGEKPVITEVSPGNMIFRAFGEKPVSHWVWNQSRPLLHFMVIEITKQNRGNDTCSSISQPDIRLELSQNMVKAFDLTITKANKYFLPKSNCAYLLINISGIITVDSGDGISTLKDNDYIFIPPQKNIKINGNKFDSAQSVLLELE
jgi:hypothetical protein